MKNTADELVASYRRAVYARAYQLCRDADHAEDLAQDTMLLGIMKLSQLKTPSKSKPWLFAILLNLYRKDYSKNKIFKKAGNGDELNNLEDESCVEGEYLKYEVFNQLNSKVEGLAVHLRAPIQLLYFRQFSYREISEEMGIPMGTVMSRIYRARKTLSMRFTTKTQLKGKILRGRRLWSRQFETN